MSTFLIIILVALLVSSCSDPVIQEGEASWYGPGFHGRMTSSGEVYDQSDTTAAHRTLPFDTVVKVVNKENDKSVTVRINDRGPYRNNRIIDLSRSAADKIDMTDSGTAQVQLKLLEAGGPIPANLEQEMFTIQIAEYNAPPFAQKFAEQVGSEARVESIVFLDRTRYVVFYGNYTSIADARRDLTKLSEEGYEGFVRQIN